MRSIKTTVKDCQSSSIQYSVLGNTKLKVIGVALTWLGCVYSSLYYMVIYYCMQNLAQPYCGDGARKNVRAFIHVLWEVVGGCCQEPL